MVLALVSKVGGGQRDMESAMWCCGVLLQKDESHPRAQDGVVGEFELGMNHEKENNRNFLNDHLSGGNEIENESTN
ncbi:hypothetical protein P8452_56453 [Trifolium repens]|nr:hypothetical protein P8452_56453 [Trifolium repens]